MSKFVITPYSCAGLDYVHMRNCEVLICRSGRVYIKHIGVVFISSARQIDLRADYVTNEVERRAVCAFMGVPYKQLVAARKEKLAQRKEYDERTDKATMRRLAKKFGFRLEKNV